MIDKMTLALIGYNLKAHREYYKRNPEMIPLSQQEARYLHSWMEEDVIEGEVEESINE